MQKQDYKIRFSYKTLVNYNPFLFKVLLRCLQPKADEKILDLGCAHGFYLKKMEKYTAGITGVDINQEAVREAVTDKVKWGDATRLELEDDAFDKIYSLHTIEHISDLGSFFKEAERVLKPGGIFILVYPFEPVRGIQAIGTATINYKNPLMARKIHVHKLNPKKIEGLIKNTSFSHVKSKLIFALGIQYLTVLKKK
jgi:ubiquinone/menaquinone biosynthesis C-methylase UbiE